MNPSSRLRLRVSPKAASNRIGGWHGEALKIAVTAAPERGKANVATIELLADLLALPKSAITLLAGDTSQDKLLRIDGVDEAELRRRIDSRRG